MTTILVVDNEQEIRDLLHMVLQHAQYDVLCAASGEQALDLLAESRHIDLLLVDVATPDVDGSSLTVMARKGRPHIAMVFTSGGPALSGMTEFDGHALLAKPYRVAQLLAVVKDAPS